MGLQDIYFVAEIIAAIAVIASLIFVGMQVSQNTDALKVTATTTNASNWQNLLIARASDKDLLKTYLERSTFPDGVPFPDLEQARLYTFLTAELKSLELLYLHWLDGNLSDALWQTNRHSLTWALARTPDYWFVVRGSDWVSGSWTPAFHALIDELLPEVNTIRAAMKLPSLLPTGAEQAS